MKIEYSHRNIIILEDQEGHWKKIGFKSIEDVNKLREELNKVENYLKN